MRRDGLAVLILAHVLGVHLAAAEPTARLGTDAFFVSNMGPDATVPRSARFPDVVYNPDMDEYFVVWQATDDRGGLHPDEVEIFAQRIRAADGAEVGLDDQRLSDMGPDGDERYSAGRPRVAYNGTDHEYLVVWEGEDDRGFLLYDELEIFGQRIDAETGAEVGENDFRISDMYEDDGAYQPSLAFDRRLGRYLVVWEGKDRLADTGSPTGPEIFGQLLDAAGVAIGVDDFPISDVESAHEPRDASIVYNVVTGEYLVIWTADDDPDAPEGEIHGRRVDAATGAPIGDADLRLTRHGPDGWTIYSLDGPGWIAADPTTGGYLLAYPGRDLDPDVPDFDLFALRLSTTAEPLLPETMASENASGLGALGYDGATHRFLKVGRMESDIRVDEIDSTTGAAAGPGTSLAGASFALGISIASDPVRGEHLVVWDPQLAGDREIMAQRLSFGPPPECSDVDADGYGFPASAACPAGPEEDCADDHPFANPGGVEIPQNGVDEDCDPFTPSGCSGGT